MEQKLSQAEASGSYILDSCPVMVAKGPRSNNAKTAREICKLTRNPTRNQWYHSIKLHAYVVSRPHRLPLPCALQVTTATLCNCMQTGPTSMPNGKTGSSRKEMWILSRPERRKSMTPLVRRILLLRLSAPFGNLSNLISTGSTQRPESRMPLMHVLFLV